MMPTHGDESGGPIDVLVAGIGNIFMHDDAFGSEVARALTHEPLPPGVRVTDYGIGGLHLAYDIADGVGTLILVDALGEGGEPGEVVVLEAALDEIGTSTIDAHGMDPATVLTSVRNLGVEPPRTLIVGCHPENVDEGMGMSDVVAAAVEPAKQAVLELIERECLTKEQ